MTVDFGAGFYAVVDRDDEALARALGGVARVIQIRLKDAPASDVLRVTRMVRRVFDGLVVVNDRVDLAIAAGAGGVHLGQTDLPIEDARAIAGRLIVGVSTHDRAQVVKAVASGADYLGYGPVFATTTKANPSPVQGIAALAAACEAAGPVPVVAIGGIRSRDGIYEAGAAAICAISAVNDAADVGAAARSLCKNFARR